MLLSGLLKGILEFQAPDRDIARLENDSRKADGKTLFVASSGYVEDAHPYVPSAYANGCRSFVVDEKRLEEFKEQFGDAVFIPSGDVASSLAAISSRFYGDPSSKMKLVGITGTSGKTTTAFAVYRALRAMNRNAGLIGTIEYRINDEIVPATNTTPDLLAVNNLMADMVQKKVEVLVMEVSSHSLSLGRVEGLNFDIAAFTNFSQDHLDFHKTMEEYLQAKLKFFDLLESSTKSKKTALINRETDHFDEVLKSAKSHPLIEVKTCSVKDMKSDYFTTIRELNPAYSLFDMNNQTYRTGMMGLTNVYNFSMAAAILTELGFKPRNFAKHFNDIRVNGRMESVDNDKGFSVIVDYAHKPDALDKLLRTVKAVAKEGGSILTVLGCGGDRDRTKRPIMGKIAGDLSDQVIITSDNPRTEDPMAIIREIEAGVKESGNPHYVISADRRNAIQEALRMAKKDDIVVIAGKGHEDYQILGKEKVHFSDREEVERFLSGMGS